MSGVIRSKRVQLRVAAALFAALAGTPSQLYAATILPNGTYAYEIAESGKAEATSTIVVTRAAGEIVISEHSSPMEATEITRHTYDATTFAARGFSNEVDGHRYTQVTIDGTEAVVEQGGRKTPLHAPPDAPFAVFDPNVGSVLQLPALLNALPAHRLTLVNLFFGTSITTVAATPSSAVRPAQVPKGDVAAEVTFDEKPATLWYDPATYVLDEFDVPSSRLSFVLKSRSAALTQLP